MVACYSCFSLLKALVTLFCLEYDIQLLNHKYRAHSYLPKLYQHHITEMPPQTTLTSSGDQFRGEYGVGDCCLGACFMEVSRLDLYSVSPL